MTGSRSARPQHVVHVTSWYRSLAFPTNGIFIARHVAALAEGRSQTLVFLRPGPFRPGTVRPIEPPVDTVDGVRELAIDIGANPVARLLGSLLAVRTIRKNLGGQTDVVHAHVHHALPAGIALSRSTGAPLLYTEHSSSFAAGAQHRMSRMGACVVGRLARRANAVSAVSPYLADRMVELLGLTERPAITTNIIDETFSNRSPGVRSVAHSPLRLTTITSLTPVKRWDVLVVAMSLLRDLDIELTVIGDGPDRGQFDRLAQALGVDDRITHVGFAEPEEVATLLSESDVYVQSSDVETFSVACAEANLLGLPIVSTQSGGPESWLPPGAARFSPAGDPSLLAASIRAAVAEVGAGSLTPPRASLDPGRQLELFYESVNPHV